MNRSTLGDNLLQPLSEEQGTGKPLISGRDALLTTHTALLSDSGRGRKGNCCRM